MTPDPEFARLQAWLGEGQDLEPPKPSLRPLFLALALVAVSLWGWSVHAATVTLTCTAPTTNTDNSPIALPLTYKAYWGTSPTTMTQTAPLAGPGCKGSLSVPDATAGGTVTYHVAVTAIAGAAESAKSNVASKTLSAPPPNPLLLLTVGGQVNVASPNYTDFSWKLGNVVGTIAPGIKCDPTRRIGAEHYRVTSPIIWISGKKDYVVAQCTPR